MLHYWRHCVSVKVQSELFGESISTLTACVRVDMVCTMLKVGMITTEKIDCGDGIVGEFFKTPFIVNLQFG